MAGARVLVRVDDLLVAGGLSRLHQLGVRPAALMNAIGAGLAENTRDRFDRETGPDGQRWAALNPAYAAMKRGPGILREAGMRGGKITGAGGGGHFLVYAPFARRADILRVVAEAGGRHVPYRIDRVGLTLWEGA